jgi:hypothetical protein
MHSLAYSRINIAMFVMYLLIEVLLNYTYCILHVVRVPQARIFRIYALSPGLFSHQSISRCDVCNVFIN